MKRLEMIYKSLTTEVWLADGARKGTRCFACNEPLDGVEFYNGITATRKNGYNCCKKCMEMSHKNGTFYLHEANKHDSIITNNHSFSTVAPKWELFYFGVSRFNNVLIGNNNSRLYYLDEQENRYTTGHIIPTVLESGWTPKVNGVKIEDMKNFEAVTRNR